MKQIPDQDLAFVTEALKTIKAAIGEDEYEKHDFRVVAPGWPGGPPTILDFDPVRSQPELGPLPFDAGYDSWDGDSSDLHLEHQVYGNEPGICYITPKEAKIRARLGPQDVKLKPDISPEGWRALKRHSPEIPKEWQLTKPEKERLRRQHQYRYNLGAGEYNYTLFSSQSATPISDEKIGHGIRGYQQLFQDPLEGDPVWDEFKQYRWCRRDYKPDDQPREFLNNQWIAGSKAPALTHDGLRLYQIHDDLPYMQGDPYERLRHRYGVDLRAIDFHFRDQEGDFSLYPELDGKYVDVYINPEQDLPIIVEVVTQHHSRKNLKKTYEKTWDLARKFNARPEYLFDTRETAYRAFEVWQQEGLADFSFIDEGKIGKKENQPIGEYRSSVQEDYRDRSRDTNGIADWTTYTKLRNLVFKDGPAPTDAEIVSLFRDVWDTADPL